MDVKYIQNGIIAFLITALIPFAFFFNSNEAKEWAFIIAPIFGLANVVFLLLISLSGFLRKSFLNLWFILIEIGLFYLILHGVGELIDLIPYEYKYDITPTRTTLKFFLDWPYDFIYTFIVITLIIQIYKLLKRGEHTHNKA